MDVQLFLQQEFVEHLPYCSGDLSYTVKQDESRPAFMNPTEKESDEEIDIINSFNPKYVMRCIYNA